MSQLDPYRRRSAYQRIGECAQPDAVRIQYRANAQAATNLSREIPGRLYKFIKHRQYLFCFLRQNCTIGCQHKPLRSTRKYRQSAYFSQILELLGEGRLGQMQLFSRASDIAFADHDRKTLYGTELK